MHVWTDSNAPKAILSLRGLGKTRLKELKYFWLQEMTQSERVKMKWVPGEQHFCGPLDEGNVVVLN